MSLAIPKRQRVGESHHRSRGQEKELAKRIGGQTVVASGSLSIKGDVRKKGVVRIEAKTTKNKSFSVTREMVTKIETAAMSTNEIPAMVIEFNDGGKKVSEVAIVPMWALEMICGEAR